MAYADAVLDNQLADLLAGQYATSKGITLSSSDLATAKTDLASMLDGAIATRGPAGEHVRRHVELSAGRVARR